MYPGSVQKLVKYVGSCSTRRSAIDVQSQICPIGEKIMCSSPNGKPCS